MGPHVLIPIIDPYNLMTKKLSNAQKNPMSSLKNVGIAKTLLSLT